MKSKRNILPERKARKCAKQRWARPSKRPSPFESVFDTLSDPAGKACHSGESFIVPKRNRTLHLENDGDLSKSVQSGSMRKRGRNP